MEAIEKILDRISQYQILNYLIPGCALCFILHYIGISIFADELLVNVVICYLVGLVNSRVSSLIINPILKGMRLIEFIDHKQYMDAKAEDPFVETMSEINNMYRSFFSVFLISIVAYFAQRWCVVREYSTIILLVALFVLFVFAYRKQTAFVKSYINRALTKDKAMTNKSGN